MAVSAEGPAAVRVADGTIVRNGDRTDEERRSFVVTNTGDRPIQIGSHVHLAAVNSALAFEPPATAGFRLDIPSGTSRRFEPGASQRLDAVALRGRRPVRSEAGRAGKE